jgi:hypothetical protein
MKPIRILLLHRDQWYRWHRIDGQFAYPVPGLIWDHKRVNVTFKMDLAGLEDKYDVIWWDDGKHRRCEITPGPGKRKVPIVSQVLYPTLNESTYRDRLRRANTHADAVFIDHDRLERWQEFPRPARRLAYSVNEYYYRDQGLIRDIDVGFYYVTGFSKERPALDEWLEGFCKRKGYRYRSTKGKNARTRYAQLLARTKVVVHLNRTPYTRPPRIFDAAASGAAFLGNPVPQVSGEYWGYETHYAPFVSPFSTEYKPFESSPKYDDHLCRHIRAGLARLLDRGHWEEVAHNAKQYVMSCHLWRHRAKELRGMLLDIFPQLRKGREEWMYQ